MQWIQRHFTSESYIMEWDLFSACRESPLLVWFFFSQPMGIISSGQSTKDLKLNLTSKQSFVKFAVCCCCFFFLFFFFIQLYNKAILFQWRLVPLPWWYLPFCMVSLILDAVYQLWNYKTMDDVLECKEALDNNSFYRSKFVQLY